MRRVTLFLGLVLGVASPAARAVVFYASGDPTYNSTVAAGTVQAACFQWVGSWGGYAGTPIGPYYFLTSKHVGGSIGQPFVFNGQNYVTTANFDDASTDLRIWQVSTPFPTWAPIYRGSSEVGSPMIMISYGLSRGAAVNVNGHLAGWEWADGTSEVLRWGEKTVASVVNGGSYWGSLLYATFSASDNPNQAGLAYLDSGGPIFINDGGTWEVAGVAAAVDGPFSTSSAGTNSFNASLFDARGLYIQVAAGSWAQLGGPSPVPSGFYATQVSARTAWIDSIVPQTAVGDTPALAPAQLLALAAILGISGLWAIRRPARGAEIS